MKVDAQLLHAGALRLAVVSSNVANYCDHIEHNEPADIETVRRAGEELRMTAIELSWSAGADTIELYAARLAAIESRNVLSYSASFDGAAAARAAGSWRALQLVQARHDCAYHPDVAGLAKWDQLHHYALHLAKLAGATAAVARGDSHHDDWLARRVPDLLLFGLKLATVTGQRLADEGLPQRASYAVPVGAGVDAC
ncbi:MAG: hypothetical protein WKF40_04540 [Thermoleophilaceae bacterium]